MTARALRLGKELLPAPFSFGRADSGRAAQGEVAVRAMLDPPSPGTMTMVPLAIEVDRERVRVSGIPGMETRVLDRSELARYAERGAARELDLRVPTGPVGPLVGAWLGVEFEERLRAENAPIPGFDTRAFHAVGDDGWLLVDAAPRVFAHLEVWLRETFAHAIERRSEALAELMIRVLPHRDETRAALWWTAPTEAKRARELTWWSRLRRDADLPADEPAMMRRIHEAADVLWPGDEKTYHETTESSLSRLATLRGARTAIAIRCAERIRPLVYFPEGFKRGDDLQTAVDDAVTAARDAALGRSIAHRHADVREESRLALLDVARAMEAVEPTAKPRGHFHPAIHALESMDEGRADQAALSVPEGMVYAAYPDDIWRAWAFQRRAQAVARRAVAADIDWLLDAGRGRVSSRFFERDLWPTGTLIGWDATIDRHQAWIDERWSQSPRVNEE